MRATFYLALSTLLLSGHAAKPVQVMCQDPYTEMGGDCMMPCEHYDSVECPDTYTPEPSCSYWKRGNHFIDGDSQCLACKSGATGVRSGICNCELTGCDDGEECFPEFGCRPIFCGSGGRCWKVIDRSWSKKIKLILFIFQSFFNMLSIFLCDQIWET